MASSTLGHIGRQRTPGAVAAVAAAGLVAAVVGHERRSDRGEGEEEQAPGGRARSRHAAAA